MSERRDPAVAAPRRGGLRNPVSGLMHLGGAIAAVFGSTILLILAGSGRARVIALLVYGFSLVFTFGASALYHLVNAGPRVVQNLRKLDHSAIFLLIAGTYTPFSVIAFTGFFHGGLLAILWGLALAGIVVKSVTADAPRWLNAGIYVAMGWLGVSAAGQMTVALPTHVIVWMIVGGVIYTLGAVIYATKAMDFIPGKFGFHEVWHVFVLMGALAHYLAVLGLVMRA
jgi:hemolysin III